ncbi:MAG: MauE/DoxX family redox-associated membrane protein [Nevskiaceae bacterium]
MPVSARFLRGLFLLLMLASGTGKLLDVPGFILVVDSFRALPAPLLAPSAWALTLTELGLAAWLAVGRRLQWAALVLVLMHAMYLAWLLMALSRGLDLPNCGCFGVYLARPLSAWSPIEDAGLLWLAAIFLHQARRAGA